MILRGRVGPQWGVGERRVRFLHRNKINYLQKNISDKLWYYLYASNFLIPNCLDCSIWTIQGISKFSVGLYSFKQLFKIFLRTAMHIMWYDYEVMKLQKEPNVWQEHIKWRKNQKSFYTESILIYCPYFVYDSNKLVNY